MEKYWGKMPYWLIVNGIKALLGEIYPEIKAIMAKYSPDSKHLLIRYYIEREPIEKDYKSASKFLDNLKARANTHIESIDVEFLYSESALEQIDWLDGHLYYRSEPW